MKRLDNLAPIRFSYDTINYQLPSPAPSPTSVNLLGTDDLGQDVLARTLYGFRISILFGLTLTLCSSVIGIIVGALQRLLRGKVDLIGQRVIEIWSGLRFFLLIILSSLVSNQLLVVVGNDVAVQLDDID